MSVALGALIVVLVAVLMGGIFILPTLSWRLGVRGDSAAVEALRRENRRLAELLAEYLRENDVIELNDKELVSRTRRELKPFYRRELGR
jgi:hypothetical protein